MTLQETKPDERQVYLDRAKSWYSGVPTKHGMFADASHIAMLAVAEYLANQDGKTFWSRNV